MYKNLIIYSRVQDLKSTIYLFIIFTVLCIIIYIFGINTIKPRIID